MYKYMDAARRRITNGGNGGRVQSTFGQQAFGLAWSDGCAICDVLNAGTERRIWFIHAFPHTAYFSVFRVCTPRHTGVTCATAPNAQNDHTHHACFEADAPLRRTEKGFSHEARYPKHAATYSCLLWFTNRQAKACLGGREPSSGSYGGTNPGAGPASYQGATPCTDIGKTSARPAHSLSDIVTSAPKT